jgi:hypothetical protein
VISSSSGSICFNTWTRENQNAASRKKPLQAHWIEAEGILYGWLSVELTTAGRLPESSEYTLSLRWPAVFIIG